MADSPKEQPSRIAPLADAPMPLDEACRVIWQTQPKQPMGQLLDQGRLARKDLEWAIQKAYRLDVKRAAQRLLQALDQPSAPVASFATAPAITTPSRLAIVLYGDAAQRKPTSAS